MESTNKIPKGQLDIDHKLDKDFTTLTSATTPLAGTEEIAIVQAGETKKVAVSEVGGGGSETYIFEYNSPILPTSDNWQTSNYTTSKHSENFRDTGASGTYPVLSQNVGSHLIRKTGNVTKIIFKLIRRNPGYALDFQMYVGKFVKNDGDVGFGTETIVAYHNIVDVDLSTTKMVTRELTLINTLVNEGEHLYIGFKNFSGLSTTLYNAQIIVITE